MSRVLAYLGKVSAGHTREVVRYGDEAQAQSIEIETGVDAIEDSIEVPEMNDARNVVAYLTLGWRGHSGNYI